MPFFEIDYAHYHYEVAGDGPPLLLLHGFTGSAASWQPQVIAFQSQFTVITIDLLGHGQTRTSDDHSRYRMELAGRDIAAFIDSVCHEPIHLLGYSMGGRLALYLALYHSHLIENLVLESASPGLATSQEREARTLADNSLADNIEQQGMEWFAHYWGELALFQSLKRLPSDQQALLHQQRLQNNPTGLAASLRGMGTGVQPSLWEQLPNLPMPTLCLAGEGDSKFVAIATQMSQTIPNARLQIIPQAGHLIHLEQPDLFHQAILNFYHANGLPWR